MALPEYEIYAIRYATVQRHSSELFIGPDPHDGPMSMDYFVWVIRYADRCFLVDTGFNEMSAALRKREWLRCPIQALRLLNIEPDSISDVILTHMHYDHAGNVRMLPQATLHLQESEMHFCCGAPMKHSLFRHSYDVADVTDVVHSLYENRVVFYQGDAELAPGVELVWIGGHTQGLQAVRVYTSRGWVMLASDATHYYANMQNDAPFPLVFNVGDMLKGYEKLRKLSDSPEHIIPGHDPLVTAIYPRAGNPSDEIMALHLPPNRLT